MFRAGQFGLPLKSEWDSNSQFESEPRWVSMYGLKVCHSEWVWPLKYVKIGYIYIKNEFCNMSPTEGLTQDKDLNQFESDPQWIV